MDDPRLNGAFNIIAFYTRTSGKSMSTPSGLYDTWVQAADLALCFQVREREIYPCRNSSVLTSPACVPMSAVPPPTTGAPRRNRDSFCELRTEIRYLV
jgi:hypothetical protein